MTEQPDNQPPEIRITVIQASSPLAVVTPVILYFFAWVFLIQAFGIPFPVDLLITLLLFFMPFLLLLTALVRRFWLSMLRNQRTDVVPTNARLRKFGLAVSTVVIVSTLFGLEPALYGSIRNAKVGMEMMMEDDVPTQAREEFYTGFERVSEQAIARIFSENETMNLFEQEKFMERFGTFAAAISDEVLTRTEVDELRAAFTQDPTAVTDQSR